MDELLKKRQEYVSQKRNSMQESEDFFMQYAQMDQFLEQEAKEQITEENLQERIEAEKEAGLAEKIMPEEELDAEAIAQIQNEYSIFHPGKVMSEKEQKKAIKEYNKKIKRVQKTQKIKDSFYKYNDKMRDMLKDHLKSTKGLDKWEQDEKDNVDAAIWLSTYRGDSVITMADTARNLSVSDDDATEEEAELKAFEIEKMINVFLNYDINKLKYKNSDDFLKNASERLMIGDLAKTMDRHFASYRRLAELGKLKKPINPKLINEAQARVNLIQVANKKTWYKIRLMSTEKYALRNRDDTDDYSDSDLELLALAAQQNLTEVREDPRASDDQAEEAYYYNMSVYQLRLLEKTSDKTKRFRRGDNPETLLAAHRKKLDEEYPVGDDFVDKLNEEFADREALTTLKKDGIKHFRVSMKSRLEKHAQNVTRAMNSPAHFNAKSREYATKTYAKHWTILRDNPKLRQQEIQKYYGLLHRGRKIPKELLDKIEANFNEKLQVAMDTDPTKLYASADEHDRKVNDFVEAHKGDIQIVRQANAVLFLLHNETDAEQVKKYNAFVELYQYQSKKAKGEEKTKEEKKADAKRLKAENQYLLDYINNFDLEKLKFNKISDFNADRLAEINQYLTIMEELQKLPAILYNLEILDDKSFLKMQARVELVMGYSSLFRNTLSASTSVVNALVDLDDMVKLNRTFVKFDPVERPDLIPEGEAGELILDKYKYEQLTMDEIGNEMVQYTKAGQGMADATGPTSCYLPGGNMEQALAVARGDAQKKLDKLKSEQ